VCDAQVRDNKTVLGLLGFALQKLHGSLRFIPATDAVFSKGFL